MQPVSSEGETGEGRREVWKYIVFSVTLGLKEAGEGAGLMLMSEKRGFGD